MLFILTCTQFVFSANPKVANNDLDSNTSRDCLHDRSYGKKPNANDQNLTKLSFAQQYKDKGLDWIISNIGEKINAIKNLEAEKEKIKESHYNMKMIRTCCKNDSEIDKIGEKMHELDTRFNEICDNIELLRKEIKQFHEFALLKSKDQSESRLSQFENIKQYKDALNDHNQSEECASIHCYPSDTCFADNQRK